VCWSPQPPPSLAVTFPLPPCFCARLPPLVRLVAPAAGEPFRVRWGTPGGCGVPSLYFCQLCCALPLFFSTVAPQPPYAAVTSLVFHATGGGVPGPSGRSPPASPRKEQNANRKPRRLSFPSSQPHDDTKEAVRTLHSERRQRRRRLNTQTTRTGKERDISP